MKTILSIIFKVLGWKVIDCWPREIRKAVVIGLPHTSNLDFFISLAAFKQIKVPYRFTIKKEWMRFPFSLVLNKLGALAIDRSHRKGTVGFIVDFIKSLSEEETFFMLITPEGTRSKVTKLKTGFYQIAMNANIPILFGVGDYEKKEAGIGGVLYPTGNYEKDLKVIADFYRDKTPRHPEKYHADLEI